MPNMIAGARPWSTYGLHDHQARARYAAQQMYESILVRRWWRQIWSALTRRSYRLLNLAQIEAICTVQNSYYTGLQMVSLDQIRGSQGRYNDFDSTFYPLKNHIAERWVQVATAHQLGVALPPVKLIQVGDIYFVQDGHHRISVAQAIGQQEIEAEVTVWKK